MINPQDFSDEIARLGIDSDVVPFFWNWFQIGYTPENTILQQLFDDAISHSQSLLEKYTPSDVEKCFARDNRLMFAPMVDTSNVTSVYGMFRMCTALIHVPKLNTSNVTNMSCMFYGCSYLTTIPQLDTSNVTNMSYMFHECKAITTIPQLDTSKVTNMDYMFQKCSVTTIPQLDMSSVTSAYSMFAESSIVTIPQLDTRNLNLINYMFQYCYHLTTISQLDMSSVGQVHAVFMGCTKLTFAIFTNIGRSTTTYDFSGATNWGTGSDENRQSLIESLIVYSYDRAANGMAAVTIRLSTTTKALLTEGEIAQITAKGFTIA